MCEILPLRMGFEIKPHRYKERRNSKQTLVRILYI